MLVHTRQLREGHNPTELQVEPAALEAMLREVDPLYRATEQPLSLKLDLVRARDTVRAHGQISGAVAFDCARCLAARQATLHIDVHWTFLPRRALDTDTRTEDEDGVRLAADDLDVSFLERDELDLLDLVREILLLELEPAPTCGIDTCEAMAYDPAPTPTPEPGSGVDPRWAGLAAIRDRMRQGDPPPED